MSPPTKYPPLRALTKDEQKWVAENLGLAKKQAYYITKAIICWRREGWKRFNQFYEDLFAAGVCGLCVAVQRYVPNDRAKISTYAFQWVRSLISHAVEDEVDIQWGRRRDGSRLHRVTLFSEIQKSRAWADDYSHNDRNEFTVWDNRPTEEDQEPDDLDKELALLLNLSLWNRERRFIQRRVLDGATLEEIANEEGISKERVRQIVTSALLRLRRSRGFMQALEKRRKRRRALSFRDFDGQKVGMFVA